MQLQCKACIKKVIDKKGRQNKFEDEITNVKLGFKIKLRKFQSDQIQFFVSNFLLLC